MDRRYCKYAGSRIVKKFIHLIKLKKQRYIPFIISMLSIVLCTGCLNLEDSNIATNTDATDYYADDDWKTFDEEEKRDKEGIVFDDEELSSINVESIDGYNNLQSFFASIESDDGIIAIEKKAKAFNLYVYDYDGGAGFWDIQVAQQEWIEEGYGPEQYTFASDSVWITFEMDTNYDKSSAMLHAAYYRTKEGNDVKYDAENNTYNIEEAYPELPMKHYNTAAEALDIVLNK